MRDIFYFLSFFSFVILQRIIELFIAKGNEKWLKAQGGIEFGTRHYRTMVLMHSMFFVSLFFEKFLLNRALSPLWPAVLSLFVFTQIIRLWALTSLGRYWNTKIIVLENAPVIKKGPYRYIKHPNYFVVTIELIIIPIMFKAYFTAGLFTILNMVMLYVRIPEEENALKNFTKYEEAFANCRRFLPILLNKSDR